MTPVTLEPVLVSALVCASLEHLANALREYAVLLSHCRQYQYSAARRLIAVDLDNVRVGMQLDSAPTGWLAEEAKETA